MYYANHSKRGKSFIFDAKNEKIIRLMNTGDLIEIKKNARHEVLSQGFDIKALSPEFVSIDEAVAFLKKERAAHNASKKINQAENRELREESNREQAAAWSELQQLEVIPATVQNIRTVLIELNSHNWGTWQLPKLSIGYSAHQYDCEGVKATTITLDKPIFDRNHGVANERKFKVGGKPGHLINYHSL